MDANSQNAILVLNALATTVDRLQSFGYALYLETKAQSWTQPRHIAVSGEGFQITHNDLCPRFERALILGFSLQYDATQDHSILFSLLFAWNSSHWYIESSVEDEDINRDAITDVLWESPKYQATTITSAIELLDEALNSMIASVTDERVASYLKSIKPRRSQWNTCLQMPH